MMLEYLSVDRNGTIAEFVDEGITFPIGANGTIKRILVMAPLSDVENGKRDTRDD